MSRASFPGFAPSGSRSRCSAAASTHPPRARSRRSGPALTTISPLPPQRDLIAAALQSIGERAVELIGEDPAFIAARDRAIAFARTPLPLLLTGPPGSGKALLARAVHAASGAIGQLVIGECRGVAPAVLSSELFGHASGDFPGALAACARLAALDSNAAGRLFALIEAGRKARSPAP